MVGLLQRTAAIVAEINDEPLNPVRNKFVNQLLNVTRRRAVVFVAVAVRLKIDVERRNINDANTVSLVGFIRELDDFLLRGLLFKLDLIAPNRDHPALVGFALAWDHLESDNRVTRASDQIDHFVQAPAHDILDRPTFALANADDELRRFQFTLLVGRSSGNQSGDFGVLVFYLQHGTNPLKREAHIDVEVLGAAR